LKVTQGERTSIMQVPRWLSAAFRIVRSCFLSPENDRATKEAPSAMASEQVSIGCRSFGAPDLAVEPRSAVGENCPFVRP
jgi:hypothetical protein